MSRFDVNKITRTPEEWSAIAFKQTTENNIQWKIALGVIVAAVAASATSPITGMAIACWSIFSAWQQAKEVQRNQGAIRDYGCVAHVLEGDDFRSYYRQVGSATIHTELNFANQQGYLLSDTALDYLGDHQDINSISEQSLLPVAPTVISPRSTPQSTVYNSQIDTQSSIHESSNVFDIVNEIVNPISNAIIFGIGGSGKGMMVANAIRQIKSKQPLRKIFYIDPKNEPGEYSYTEGVVDVVRRKTCYGCCPEEIIDWMDEILDEYIDWANQQEESLLIIDEGSTLGDAASKCKNNRIGTLILHTASLGGAKRKNVWLMAQSPFVEPLGLKLASTSQIVAIALISSVNIGVITQWKRSPILGKIDDDRLLQLIKESPVGRAVYFGGSSKWYAMPELPNYSAIDRDNDKPNGDSLSTEQRQSLRERTTTTQQVIDLLERSRYSDLDQFIIEELKAGDRLDEVKRTIIKMIRDRDHYGLVYKFKLKRE